MSNEMIFDHKTKPDQYDDLAPDGSEIRLLTRIQRGSCAHCILPAGKTSLAVQHKTVEEIWYVLSGKGEMWQRSGRGEASHDCPGHSEICKVHLDDSHLDESLVS